MNFPESIPWNDEPTHHANLEREDEMPTYIGAGQTDLPLITTQLTVALEVEETDNGDGSHAFRDTNLEYHEAGLHFLIGSREISGDTTIRQLWERLPEQKKRTVEREARANARKAAGIVL